MRPSFIAGFWGALLLGGQAAATSPELFRDADFDAAFDTTIEAFWTKEMEPGKFTGTGGLELAMASSRARPGRPTVVVVTGFRESLLKYKEVIYDFHKNGFDVLTYDHRGQGLSPRVSPAVDAIYVDSFEDYVQDLQIFITTVAAPRSQGDMRIFAHSMGAAVTARLMEREPRLVDRAVLSSPMLGIRALNLIPEWILDWYWKRAFAKGQGHELALFQKPANPAEPVPSFVTSSVRRRLRFAQETQARPNLLPGEASIRWTYEAYKGAAKARAEAHRLRGSLLMLQAENEYVVDNGSQRETCKAAPKCELVVIAKARHEIWNEDDEARLPALGRAIEFLR